MNQSGQNPKFLTPPTVTGTLDIGNDPVDVSKDEVQTPLPGNVIRQIETILVPADSPRKWSNVQSSLQWKPAEVELLKLRWRNQGTSIPELRRPDHPNLINFFTGRFSADEIGRKAMSLGLR